MKNNSQIGKITNKLSSILRAAGSFFNNMINNHYFIFTIVLSLILNVAIEIAARHSFFDGFKYLFTHPIFFLYNSVLIILSFSIALLFRKRIFSMLFILALWVSAGIANSVLIVYRRSPLIAADFSVLKSALSIMNVYMTKFQMILVIVSITAVLVSLILLLIKEKRKKIDYRKIAVMLAISVAVSVIPSDYIMAEKSKTPNANITDEAYKYGFVCCFLNSVFNNGVNRPSGYSKHKMSSIVKAFDREETPTKTPNIVVLQLESFIDPYKIDGAKYSQDPIPNFRRLKENYSSGLLNVSVFGGGTANTEFEVLTEMNLQHFGIGEYPYETVLKEQPLESVCYDLNEIGYTSHALHNHTGTFYDRHEVYKNLGFDTFTPVEYMNNIEYNLLGWEKSNVFTDEILNTLSSTKGKDFIFTVTSQCHGKYPDEYEASDIEVSGTGDIEKIKPQLEYFCDQLYEEDKWLGTFISELKKYPEPVMVVMYGDHMPALNITYDMMDEESLYQTEYVIWSNYHAPKENMDLCSYNLMAKALSTLNINNGYFTKLHQYSLENNLDVSAELKNMQYDVINGEKFLYGSEEEPYEPTNMKLGINEIAIKDVRIRRHTTTILGENFTTSSIVYVNDNPLKTEFIDSETLTINNTDYKTLDEIKIAQRAPNFVVLGYSKPYYPKNNNK